MEMLIKNTRYKWFSDCKRFEYQNLVKCKIRNVGGLVKKTDYDAKIKDIERKYFTTADYNKFTNGKLDVKIKWELKKR